eukprot:g4953.t1
MDGRLRKVAEQCLFLGRPTAGAERPRFRYPADAEAHYEAVHAALASCCSVTQRDGCRRRRREGCGHKGPGYKGPWIENYWIEHFRALYSALPEQNRKLSVVFGPYIPLLVTWVDNWANFGQHYPPMLKSTLLRVLRKDVMYITVSQNAQGLAGAQYWGRYEMDVVREFPNILVLSAGGYGNVPVPLLKQPMNLRPDLSVPVSERKYDLSYVGSVKHSPHRLRPRVLQALTSSALSTKVYEGNQWVDIMYQSKASLVPRGFGRTAYHLAEAIQSALVPVYVYDDVPWVPYPTLFAAALGYVVQADNATAFFTGFADVPDEEIERRERACVQFVPSHFSFCGVIDQISRFMLGRHTDLRCVPLPETVTGA